MKKAILVLNFVLLANCGGADLGDCGQGREPYSLSLVASPTRPSEGDNLAVTVIPTDQYCEPVAEGTPIRFQINGCGLVFERSSDDFLVTYMSATGASVDLVATRAECSHNVVSVFIELDNEIFWKSIEIEVD